MTWPTSMTPEFLIAVALGQVPGHTRAFGIGYNPDVDTTSTPEDVWDNGGTYPFLDAAVQMQIRSTDPNDTADGTGMRTLSGAFLNGSYAQTPQTITMNGTTAVPVGAVLANNGLRGLTAGSNGTNIGTIILEALGGGTIYGMILPGIGVSNQAPYTVPAGQTLVVPQLILNVNSSPAGGGAFFAQVRTWFRFFSAATGTHGCAIQPLVLGLNNGVPYPHLSDPPIMVPEKSRFSLRANVVSDNNTVLTAGWNGFLKSN